LVIPVSAEYQVCAVSTLEHVVAADHHLRRVGVVVVAVHVIVCVV
jgi:uncharacterized protein YjeT (DUF2065 family)